MSSAKGRVLVLLPVSVWYGDFPKPTICTASLHTCRDRKTAEVSRGASLIKMASPSKITVSSTYPVSAFSIGRRGHSSLERSDLLYSKMWLPTVEGLPHTFRTVRIIQRVRVHVAHRGSQICVGQRTLHGTTFDLAPPPTRTAFLAPPAGPSSQICRYQAAKLLLSPRANSSVPDELKPNRQNRIQMISIKQRATEKETQSGSLPTFHERDGGGETRHDPSTTTRSVHSVIKHRR